MICIYVSMPGRGRAEHNKLQPNEKSKKKNSSLLFWLRVDHCFIFLFIARAFFLLVILIYTTKIPEESEPEQPATWCV